MREQYVDKILNEKAGYNGVRSLLSGCDQRDPAYVVERARVSGEERRRRLVEA